MLMRKFRALLFRHGVIEQAIESEQKRARPDTFKLLKLKRLRLTLKDQLSRIALAMESAGEPRLAPARAVQRSDMAPRKL